ncbi:MAG: peptidylprolyl isomerase [Bacteroidaceae bacterium]|nr:peptidylprolyl isomerase [Bacteroidaceae bacterium]
MNKNVTFLFLAFALLAMYACGGAGSDAPKTEFGIEQLNEESPDCDQYVLMETSMGNIKLKLYKETPQHRKNFVNLVKNGFYDGQLFFRVTQDFMIQAGDPKSRGAAKGAHLGTTEVSYNIPMEIDVTKYWHKRGALSAASLKPGISSSGCQFYIITGKKVYDKNLDAHEVKYNKTLRRLMYESLQKPYADKINKLYAESKKSAKKKRELNDMIHMFSAMTDSAMAGKKWAYTKEQRRGYKEDGGAFHLDGYYTVFGEVIEGIEIVEAISRVDYDVRERPLKDVVIKKVTLLGNEDK